MKSFYECVPGVILYPSSGGARCSTCVVIGASQLTDNVKKITLLLSADCSTYSFVSSAHETMTLDICGWVAYPVDN